MIGELNPGIILIVGALLWTVAIPPPTVPLVFPSIVQLLMRGLLLL